MIGNIEWLFFDVGSTLIDERYANEHRLRDAIRGTDISYDEALARANCRPERAAMIGDRLDNDIVPAKRLGMATIWIRQGFGGMAENLTEAETPDYSVRDLRELAELLR